MTIRPHGRRPAALRRRRHRRLRWRCPLLVALAVLAVTGTATARDARNGEAVGSKAAQLVASEVPSYASITNGTLRLGVNPQAHLDAIVDDGELLGLEYAPTGAEGLVNGCWCEGWGIADRTAGVAGWASVANGGVAYTLGTRAFEVTSTTADSTVEVGERLRVRHVFHPSARPELYQVDLTVENIGAAAADVVYRRAMDWDVPPTEFDEFVTIQGAHPRLLDSTDNGFNNVNPLLPLYDLGARGTFEDVGPDDRGSAFDFALGTLAPGESASLTMFYGAASTETDALEALAAVDADLYSLGQSNTPGGPTLGTPTTFVFGVTDGAAASGPIIAVGRLVLPGGGPALDGDAPVVSGSVALYLASTDGDTRTEDTLVASATTEPDGSFVLRTPYTAALAAAAAVNDGELNLDIVANANGFEYLEPIIRSFVDSAWVSEGGLDPVEIAANPVTTATNPRLIPGSSAGTTTGSTALAGGCVRYRFPLDSRRAWTTIGELHTPADTEVASFTYGQRADSYVSKAFSLDGATWLVKGMVKVGSEATSSGSSEVSITTPNDRWAREIQTEFVYTRYRVEMWCGVLPAKASEHYEVRATDWVGNIRTRADLTYLDNRCAQDHAEFMAPIGRDAQFQRDSARYGTFSRAATLTVGTATIELASRSGMSRWVRLSWRFGNKTTRHILCGTDDFPPRSSRIFAGA